MALQKCLECKGVVSTEAKVCPHCGAPSPTPKAINAAKSKRNQRLITVFLLIGWPIFIALMYIQSTHNPVGFYH
jgi:predicted amidophosphoribosyltransferase